MIKKILLSLLTIILIIPLCNAAVPFEKDYFVILTDEYEIKDLEIYEKVNHFNFIENKIFNNNLCDKYDLRSVQEGCITIKPPTTINNQPADVSHLYCGKFDNFLYKCDRILIFDFKFYSRSAVQESIQTRYLTFRPEFVYFENEALNKFINKELKTHIKNMPNLDLERGNNLFEFLSINQTGFQFSDNLCNELGYYLINEFHPAIFSDYYKNHLCSMGAYSLLKNHFLYMNDIQGFFISDYEYDEDYNFDMAFENILIRKLAEKAIYKSYYNEYQTKNPFISAWLTLFRPNDKSKLYDIQSKNLNIQLPEFIDFLSNVDNQLRVSVYNELAITRIDRKNEMLGWFSIIIGLIGGFSLLSVIKWIKRKVKIGKWYIKIKK